MFELSLQKTPGEPNRTIPKKFTRTIGVTSESILDELNSVNPYKEHQSAFHIAEKAAKKAKEGSEPEFDEVQESDQE